MKQDKEAITEILSAIAQAQLALGEAERAFQDMVKSMPTCREPDWLPQGFGNAGFEPGVGGAGYSGDEKDFVVYIVEAQGMPGAAAAERRYEHDAGRSS